MPDPTEMLLSPHGLLRTAHTLSPSLPACSGLAVGRALHGYAVKLALSGEPYVATALLGMYAQAGDTVSARSAAARRAQWCRSPPTKPRARSSRLGVRAAPDGGCQVLLEFALGGSLADVATNLDTEDAVHGCEVIRRELARKGISAALFSVSTTVSSFTNGGLLPTNESMAVFAANRGLLLLLAAQILAGSTLLPVFLRLAVSATRGLARVLFLLTGRGGPVEELVSMDMENSAAAAGFGHLLPSDTRAASLAATVVAVAAAAAALLCCLNCNSAVFAGLTAGEKVTNAVFMAVNVRQAGENSVDCSLVAPAVLVLFLAMMCIPASATLLSVHDDGDEKKRSGAGEPERKDGEKKRRLSLNSMLLSPLACNAAAVMLACITERRSISGDPLNFSTFNVIFEVISAYGNMGLSTGYSCLRLLPAAEATATCHDKPYSFSGWWSDQGKLVIILRLCWSFSAPGALKGAHYLASRNWQAGCAHYFQHDSQGLAT
ncbi:cation transporter HKT2;4-like [Miscanthus floridulus]|uniref:cation transporter HKT2;4-like n=1 Tax=Miscanthus floridulus TaxID=154761 RepID=UPI003457CB3C